jgi:UDP-N-acetylglucosamine--N-acetylmuramyl-(pentapeptide) pyrophosphoryl-undecaprenol N-acetylglucosamine transferase
LRKIYFSVFGSGIGHVTRIHDIAGKLREDGDEFTYSSCDEGYSYLKRSGEKNVVQSPVVDVFRWNESGSFSTRRSFLSFPLALPTFTNQVRFEMKNVGKLNPKVVISESRLSAILAARLKGKPVITILNQFKVLFPPRFRGHVLSGLFERMEGDGLGVLWSLSDRILMPDLPPPYTIGEANIAGSDLKRRVNFVGFMTPQQPTKEMCERAKNLLGIDGRPLVFIQISGPSATKEKFVQDVLNAVGPLSKEFCVVISLGLPNGSTEPKKLTNGAWLYEWCPIKDELFSLSRVLVGRSGHRTIEQCIDTGKPAVLIPVHNHSEQLGNAEKFTKLGLGIEIKSEDLTSDRLVESVDQCMNDSKYASNVENLRFVSEKCNGIENSVQIINQYL